jgi:hypothetical protein
MQMRNQDVPPKQQMLKPLNPRSQWVAWTAVEEIEVHGYLKQVCIAFFTVAVSVILLLLSGVPGHAQQGPFADLAGSWSGGGQVTLSGGSRERLQCRANYSVRGGGSNLQLALRCASDSYNFDFRGNAKYSGGAVTGSWSEATQNAGGQFSGRASGNHIGARIEGASFSASLSMTTNGNRQSISIRSPGSEFSDVAITLTRR